MEDALVSGRTFIQPCIYHGGRLPSDLPDDLTPQDVIICPGCEEEE